MQPSAPPPATEQVFTVHERVADAPKRLKGYLDGRNLTKWQK